MTNVKALRQRLAQTDALLWRSYRALARVKRQRDDYRAQLRQNHPGMAAHLPPTGRPPHVPPAAAVKAVQRVRDIHEAAPERSGPPFCTECLTPYPCNTIKELERGLAAPRALAAAPPGDEDQKRTRGLLKSAWRESEGWRGQAERLARLLVRDRMALARVKAQRDDKRHHVSDLAAHLAVNLGALLAPLTGHEDEAAVERAARVLHGFELDMDWADMDDERRSPWLVKARAALAAARGPRTPGRDRG